MPGKIAARLKELRIELPKAGSALANYVPVVLGRHTAYVSGQITIWNGEIRYQGRVGESLSLEEGQQAARLCALNVIAQLQAALGDLDRVRRVAKLTVFINSADGFVEQGKVGNGASDLLVEVFGEAGRHARSAVGVNVLPFNVAVEIEAIVEFDPEAN